MTWQGFDDRKFPRIDSNVEVSITYSFKDNLENFKAEIKNIGIGGFCVFSKKKLSIFDIVEVSFDLPKQTKKSVISCKAKAVWVIGSNDEGLKHYDIGFEFMNLKVKDKDKIQKFVDICSTV